MSDEQEAEQTIEVRILLPLPLDVSGTLMSAIGTGYPGAMVRTDGPRAFGMDVLTFLIPESERWRKGNKRAIAAAKMEADPDADVQVTGFDGNGLTFNTPEEWSLELGHIAAGMLKAAGAVNYLEAECRDSEGTQYVVCAARSKGQTPHALRTKAEERLHQIEDMLAYFDLHIGKHPWTQLTTVQKELMADLIDAGSAREAEQAVIAYEPRLVERWWRD